MFRSQAEKFAVKGKHLVALILLNFGWAASLSMYQYLKNYLEPGGIVTFRFGLAALLMLPFWPLFRGPTPRGKDLFVTALMGAIVFCIGHRLQVYGSQVT